MSLNQLTQRIETSRQIASDPRLGAKSGYVTLVRAAAETARYRTLEALYAIKVRDAEAIQAEHFTRLHPEQVGGLNTDLNDLEASYEALVSARLSYHDPLPPVEVLWLANLTHAFIDLTQPPSVMCLGTSTEATAAAFDEHLLRVESLAALPYFAAAIRSRSRWGILINGFGLVTFAPTVEEAHSHLLDVVRQAEKYIANRKIKLPVFDFPSTIPQAELVQFRAKRSRAVGQPQIVSGVANTSDQPLPESAAAMCTVYPIEQAALTQEQREAPLIHDPTYGVFAIGDDVQATQAQLDAAQRALQVHTTAGQLGASIPVDVLTTPLPKPPATRGAFRGEIAFVTRAAHPMGKAISEAFMAEQAAVIGIDSDPAVVSQFPTQQFCGIHGDVSSRHDLARAVASGVQSYGGIDMVVLNLNLGYNTDDSTLNAIERWHHLLRISLDEALYGLEILYPILQHAPNGGRIVLNTVDPASTTTDNSDQKLARTNITQLGEIAGSEWRGAGIRVHVVHPSEVPIRAGDVSSVILGLCGSTFHPLQGQVLII